MTRRPEIAVRPVTEEELPEWNRALNTGFLRDPAGTGDQMKIRRAQFAPDRLLGAFEGDRCVATYRSFAQELTTPGGIQVPAEVHRVPEVIAHHFPAHLCVRLGHVELGSR